MDPSRREVVVGLAALVAACRPDAPPGETDSGEPDPDSVPPDTGPWDSGDSGGDTDSGDPVVEPTEWDAGGFVDLAAFPAGVQVGDPLDTSALTSVRSSQPLVDLRLAEAIDGKWVEIRVHPGVPVTASVAQLPLEGLSPDTAYSVVFAVSDGRRSRATRFRTAPAAGTGTRVLRLGATSCLGGNEPWKTLSVAAAQRYDLFLLLGDTIYADWPPPGTFEEKWDDALVVPGFADLSASTGLVAVWDDHEVLNDWFGLEGLLADIVPQALSAFRRAIPQRVGPGPGLGLWRKLSWGDTLEIFLLETRSERYRPRMLSEDQLDWVIQNVGASTARFKLIVTSSPMTDLGEIDTASMADRWQSFPEQREALLSALASVPGVLWLSGDRHVGFVGKVDPQGGLAEHQWEIWAGPGGSNPNPLWKMIPLGARFPVALGTWTYTELVLDPDAGTATARFFDDLGSELAAVVLDV